MQPPPALPIYEFGDFELDTRRRVLTTRADGKEVEITGRVLDALIFLVERPGQRVDKKTLMDALWPSVVVEEGNLTQTIHTLRKVLGETAGEHRYIATVPGRGYQFVAEVQVRDAQAAPAAKPEQEPAASPTAPTQARRTKAVLAIVTLSLVLLTIVAIFVTRGRDQPLAPASSSAPPSIAVLAFVDMSEAQDQAHFADGLSEEILNTLAHSDALRVIARTSSFSFRDRDVDIKTIAQRLAVTHVLEGSVRKSGNRMRITAQLIDASNSAHVWSDTFDRDVHDIFGVQSEIASAVADALHVTLGPVGPSRAETTSTDAYEHYLQGRLLFNRRSGDDIPQAKLHFEKAVEIDPKFARAWSALAGVYLVARYEGPELRNANEEWRKAAERAVALAPDLAEAQYRLAQFHFNVGNDQATLEHLNRAIALDPREPLLIGRQISIAIMEGRLEEAVELQRRVTANDPLSATQRGNLGSTLILVKRFQEAQAEMERALELSPASARTTAGIADIQILQGRIDEALKVISRLPAGIEQDRRLALAFFARGDAAQGREILARLLAQVAKPGFDLEAHLAIAEVYAQIDDKDQAFAWLDQAHRYMTSQPGLLPRMRLKEKLRGAYFLNPLHGDPRWPELLASIKTQ